ncbi:MAG: DUF3467 domain-containing protein [Anaerolineaceae bacterium]|jgi:hypothetical protein|nr:DUF3467 domain-containing protein [Anaerolineaceae bacterium]
MTERKNIIAKQIKIERLYPKDLQSHFVSNVVVQHQPDIFILSFFEVWPPAILGDSDEEKKDALESIEKVEANCVARLVLTPDKMKEFVEVMTENINAYEEMMQIQNDSIE